MAVQAPITGFGRVRGAADMRSPHIMISAFTYIGVLSGITTPALFFDVVFDQVAGPV